jgi:membrane peptidoglycan carboxypeptidase
MADPEDTSATIRMNRRQLQQVFVEPAPPAPFSARARLRRRYKRYAMRSTRRRLARPSQTGRYFALSSAIIVFLLVVLVLTGVGTGAYAAYTFYQSQNHFLANIDAVLPKDSLRIYDDRGDLIYEMRMDGSQTTVPLDKVSPNVINATVAIEDKDFWTNQGVEFTGVVRAALSDLTAGHVVSGASTITQQLIKNATGHDEVTLDRKLREMIMAIGLTQHYSKSQILWMYLNSIYYGEQAYGIDAAAQAYFGYSDTPTESAAQRLDLAQASMLAGLPSSPDAYDPYNHPQAARIRQTEVLNQMVRQGYITPADETAALKESAQPGFLKPEQNVNLVPAFSQYVLGQLSQMVDSGSIPLARTGLNVYTTLDLPMQQAIQKEAAQNVQLESWHNLHNASVVVIDYHTGAVKTLVGSVNYNDSSPYVQGNFDVATDGYRQPGSSFKPFVYVTAFEEGWSPGTPICDCPLAVPNPGGSPPVYKPLDYDLRFHGELPIRVALQNSYNVPAVKTLMFAGIQNSLVTAERMGITQWEGTPGPSMVLGGLSIHLFQETSAYGVFADYGKRVPPYVINHISDPEGHMLYQYHVPTPVQVISPQLAYMMTSVLSDNNARIPEFGRCGDMLVYSNSEQDCLNGNPGTIWPAAAKTGTSQDFRDNLTLGYTMDYVVGVWAGNSNGAPMNNNADGITGAGPIWHDAMLIAEHGHTPRAFPVPSGLVRATVSACGLTTTDWYLAGAVPHFPQGICGTNFPVALNPGAADGNNWVP